MRIKDQANITTIMAIVMLVCFMLPWLKIGPFNLEGYIIPVRAKDAGMFSLASLQGGFNYKAYIAYILYLIPIASAMIIVQQIRDKSVTLLSIVAGVIPWLIVIQFIIKHGMNAFNNFQIGLYISAIAGLLMILDSTGTVKIPGLASRR